MMTTFLQILLLAAALYLGVKSPRKWQTFGRMLVAFVTVLLLSIIGSVFLRIGAPEVWGVAGRLVGLLLAVVVGWRGLRSLPRAGTEPSQQPRPKNQPEAP
jgi:hypothetical protein